MNYAQLLVGQPFRDKASGEIMRIVSVIDQYSLVDRKTMGAHVVMYRRQLVLEHIPADDAFPCPVISQAVMPEGLRIAVPMALNTYMSRLATPDGVADLSRLPAVDFKGESTACTHIACPHPDHVNDNTSPSIGGKAVATIHLIDLNEGGSTPPVGVGVSRPDDLLEALAAMEVEVANSPGRLGMVCPALDL